MIEDGRLTDRHGVWYVRYWENGREVRKSLKTRDRLIAEARRCRLLGELLEASRFDGLDRVRAANELSGALVIALRSPLVYAWYRGDQVLYVGKGASGLGRPLSPHHHKLSGILPTDVLRFWSCASAEEASLLEANLIDEWHPLLNGAETSANPDASEPALMVLTQHQS